MKVKRSRHSRQRRLAAPLLLSLVLPASPAPGSPMGSAIDGAGTPWHTAPGHILVAGRGGVPSVLAADTAWKPREVALDVAAGNGLHGAGPGSTGVERARLALPPTLGLALSRLDTVEEPGGSPRVAPGRATPSARVAPLLVAAPLPYAVPRAGALRLSGPTPPGSNRVDEPAQAAVATGTLELARGVLPLDPLSMLLFLAGVAALGLARTRTPASSRARRATDRAAPGAPVRAA